MSNAALRTITDTDAPVARKAPKNDLVHLLNSPQVLAQIRAALPRHMTAERMARVALTELRKTPKLAKCDPRTFIGAVIQLSQLGLEPGGLLGHAYLLPFENNKLKTTDVQVIIGYRGMIDLARRSGQIKSLSAVAVREGDTFHVELGLVPSLRHVPKFEHGRPLTFVYAVANLQDGGQQFDVMSHDEIEAVRRQSRASTTGPWVTHFEEMAKKTVIRRLFKMLPVSIEIQRAVSVDERSELGLSLDAEPIEGSAIVEDPKEEPPLAEERPANYAEIMEAMNVADEPAHCDQLERAITTIKNPQQRKELETALAAKREDINAHRDPPAA
jgi:recombination protein RecT